MSYGEPLSSTKDLKGRDGVDLLARMLYSEARGETEEGKRGCAYVASNRKDKNKTEFGGNTWEGVILKKYAFVGMTTTSALKPDLTSDAWDDSLDIATNLSSKTNPIGTCLWFVTNSYYKKHIKTSGSKESYSFDGGSTYTEVVEKVVIGGHTFFKVKGY